ncbi:linear amide C-N hydrolase [Francisella adeliensis]|uniref:Choloylglycine hydrolase n=1 Tax=Francisella adeliensis TaxID=2007306 RepID=A0A2Z4XZ87_9GAMM|nr:linear amide C-N hydrolase [Francisella adeliensis]AXA34074.1 choloylglycine hydrolase [Francisella adeliensis]MBK2085239.1 linear amide C-N hydrolase [Francisella adeliensis]MBK2095993.1 linear amide C-N hydrolase [Francisella adeliensis]QIW12314.1 linear amide C-N hydrolase [Francisella adeliensis]QIW14188.1 linear amide C-N hydrolase [Francisella adeliensis]
MKKLVSKILISTIGLAVATPSFACSELNHDFGEKLGVYSARTMDSFINLKPSLTVYPRGTKESSHLIRNPLNWTDKYGYVSVDETNLYKLTAEGINEKGLTAHLLYSGSMKQPQRDIDKKGINGLAWIRYALGNYATVQEVIDGLSEYQIYTPKVEVNNKKVTLPIHFSIEDAAGNSAVIEYTNGKLTVNKGAKVMTNEPSFEDQETNLSNAKKDGVFNIDIIPGGAKSENRFVRASFISENLPDASTRQEAVNYMFSAADSLSVPFVKDYDKESFDSGSLQDKWPTQWKSVISMKNKRLYLSDVLVGNRVYVDLNEANLSKGQPVKTISIMNDNLTGDITNKMVVEK